MGGAVRSVCRWCSKMGKTSPVGKWGIRCWSGSQDSRKAALRAHCPCFLLSVTRETYLGTASQQWTHELWGMSSSATLGWGFLCRQQLGWRGWTSPGLREEVPGMPAPRKAIPLNCGTRGEMHSVRVALEPAGSGIPQAQGRAAEASRAADATAGGGSASGPRRLRQPGEARLWWS